MSEPRAVDLNPEEQRAFTRVMSLLEVLLHASRGPLGDWLDPPAPGSLMARAFDAALREPYTLANLLLLSAEDHLRAMLLVRQAGSLPQFALHTLLRAASEASVRARHLLDPQISEKERLARGLSERLENLLEQKRVDPEAMSLKFGKAVDRLEKRALENGIVPKRKKGTGPIYAFGEPRPPMVQLFSDYIPDGGGAYRLLSGFTHSMLWVQVHPQRAQPTSTPGVSDVALDMDVVLFSNLLTIVLVLFDEDIRLLTGAAGYPPEVWKAAKHLPPQASASQA